MRSTIPDGTVRTTESTATPHEAAGTSGTPRWRATGRFLRHFAEMVVAMLLGMLLLGPAWEALATAVDATTGFDAARMLDRPDVDALVMATNMTLAMTVWMRHRGHRWAPVAEMGAAMYLPFLLFLPPYWVGAVDGGFLTMAGHLLMLPAMLLVMLRRLPEYTGAHAAAGHVAAGGASAGHASAGHAAPGRTGRVVEWLKRRWPTWLALLMTVDNWADPAVLDAWVMLVLPVGYLVIGTVRRQFGDRRILALQLAGLVFYLFLVGAALLTPDELGRYLVGAGWLVHAGWDYAHHRANRVVPRGFSEWCGVVDVVIGITIIFLA
ncbi:hypothetical protein O7626_16275 [Micromonospora sp. WMMD1102]|uniref:hypothetical protein n=1 Tax=Micromonospora sp. WMMD1102 TaxID=3016105 RepID=UPI002414E9E7|nr:hypothetical protein [Micromonospora sp. WMMD1102]MDG4787470.1 hypothetical protein [Micromonospora sp. WMMD1102]